MDGKYRASAKLHHPVSLVRELADFFVWRARPDSLFDPALLNGLDRYQTVEHSLCLRNAVPVIPPDSPSLQNVCQRQGRRILVRQRQRVLKTIFGLF